MSGAGFLRPRAGYGANLCILPATLHERYGNKHFGSIWRARCPRPKLAFLLVQGSAPRCLTAALRIPPENPQTRAFSQTAMVTASVIFATGASRAREYTHGPALLYALRQSGRGV